MQRKKKGKKGWQWHKKITVRECSQEGLPARTKEEERMPKKKEDVHKIRGQEEEQNQGMSVRDEKVYRRERKKEKSLKKGAEHSR